MPTFRFGVVFTAAYSPDEWRNTARRLEGEGFGSLLVADHYANPMSCGPLMMAAAAATTTLRVGSYVYNNDFRHLALLAKEAATIDVLSGGRLEIGLGAGWLKDEYDEAGLAFDPPGVRASRFEESVGILKRLWRGETVHHAGEHYTLDGLTGTPLPVQHPLPLLIGGGGPRMLRFAVSEADVVALVPRSLPSGGLDPADFSADAMDVKARLIDDAIVSSERGAPPERSAMVFGAYPSAADAGDSEWIPQPLIADSPHAFVGDAARVEATLVERFKRWGLSYYVFFEEDIEKVVPVVRRLSGVTC